MNNTQAGIGMRKNFGVLGQRNFENSGTVQYKALREPFYFRGVLYHSGDLLPFDVGGVSYSAEAVRDLQSGWDEGQIQPAV